MLYLTIFTFKILENTLATLRIIVLSNSKKYIAAILNLIISITWVISTSLVVTNINEDSLKIIVFAFGCLIGSFLGSILEEKMAIGNYLLMVISKKNITKHLKNINYKKINKNTTLIFIKRKERIALLKQLKVLDSNITIYSNLSHQLDLNKI